MSIDVQKLAEKLSDAYSTYNYGGDWSSCIKMLERRGYNVWEIEAIIRSKWTRWAADGSNARYGRKTSADLARFLDKYGQHEGDEVAALVKGTFGTVMPS